jgi:hypothetical protein
MNLQETATIGDNIEHLLSCIVALETHFATSPGDVKELRRRRDLIRYVVIPPLRLGAELLPASSWASKDSCCPWLITLSRRSFPIIFKTMEMSADFSKTYRRLSTTTGFVHDRDALPHID